jgi:hypothetical protein
LINAPLAAEQLADLFRRSGIRRPVNDLKRIETMILNASLTITAWQGGRLVGIARSITDFCYCCYLSDLAVDRDLQRCGIGRDLVSRTKSAVGDDSMLLLLSAPESMEYYPKIGMEAAQNAWIIKRTG